MSRTERVRLAGMLMNVAAIRSDFFVAYVVVRGYPSADWRQGAIESGTFMVIFDRSNVTAPTDRPKILAYKRVN